MNEYEVQTLTLIMHIKQTQPTGSHRCIGKKWAKWKTCYERNFSTGFQLEAQHPNNRKSLNPVIWTKESRGFNKACVSCLYLQTTCCWCWSLTFEIIIYDPKQLSGLGLSWDQEFQKPLRDEGILYLRLVSTSFTMLQSSIALYLHSRSRYNL